MDDISGIEYSSMNPVSPVAANPLPVQAGSAAATGHTFSFPGLSISNQPPVGVVTGSSRPGRYDDGIETTPLTPLSSSQNLHLVFDSRKVYDKHPHKYRLLLETETESISSGKPSVSASSSTSALGTYCGSTAPPLVTVEDGHVVAMGATSSGPVATADVITATPGRDSGVRGVEPKIVVTTADGRIKGSGTPFTLSEAIASSAGANKKTGSGRDSITGDQSSKYVPHDFLEKFRAVSFQPSKKTEEKSTAIPPPSFASSSAMPSAELPTSLAMQSREVALGGTGAQIHESASRKGGIGSGSDAGWHVVQPQPRRLFGFGPLYRPLPETVHRTKKGEEALAPSNIGRRSSSPTLSFPTSQPDEGVTKMGYAGPRRSSVNVDSTDGVGPASKPKKPSPTPAELNAWLTGSF